MNERSAPDNFLRNMALVGAVAYMAALGASAVVQSFPQYQQEAQK